MSTLPWLAPWNCSTTKTAACAFHLGLALMTAQLTRVNFFLLEPFQRDQLAHLEGVGQQWAANKFTEHTLGILTAFLDWCRACKP